MAQVLVQNRVSLALPVIPDLVQREGISVKKMSPSTMMIVNLVSPDKRYDSTFLSNYATIYIKDELGRLPGVAGDHLPRPARLQPARLARRRKDGRRSSTPPTSSRRSRSRTCKSSPGRSVSRRYRRASSFSSRSPRSAGCPSRSSSRTSSSSRAKEARPLPLRRGRRRGARTAVPGMSIDQNVCDPKHRDPDAHGSTDDLDRASRRAS